VPEENFASSEHELIQEITAPFAAVRQDPEADPGEADFPIVLRGYDRVAVDAYFRQTRQVIDDLRATSSPEAAVRRALERVGEEVSGILQRAHDTAAEITSQSRSEAEDRLEAVRQEAEQITAAAENRVKELDAETDRIWAERLRIVEDTRDLARQLLSLSDSAADRFPADEEPEAPATPPPAPYDGEDPGLPIGSAEDGQEPPELEDDDETVERESTSVLPRVEAPPGYDA
jgi:uncharacterized membrane protein YccC